MLILWSNLQSREEGVDGALWIAQPGFCNLRDVFGQLNKAALIGNATGLSELFSIALVDVCELAPKTV